MNNMAEGKAPAKHEVRRRRVFYIPGYDPFHPRRYRELYRKESSAQAGISGYDIALSPGPVEGRYGWHVAACIDGKSTATDFEVMVWSDIVKQSMDLNIPQTYLLLARTAWTYISSGVFLKLLQTRKGPVIAALYPIAMLLLQLVLAVFTGILGGKLLALLHPVLFWPALPVTAVFMLHWFRKIDNRLFAYYLMHDYSWSARNQGASPPELETRVAEFTDAIAAALTEEVEEVLVVGHSSGAHIGVSVLADLLRAGRLPVHGPELSFLTLGQVVPMVSFLKDAWRLRADLACMAAQDQVPWVDVTAPGDGCAFALCDPVSVSGVAPEGKRWPLVFSAAFTQSLTPARWRELRWRFFRLHFQYLCAFDAPKDYDYFQITAGPLTLWNRYKNRPPSRSRKEQSLSPYRSTSP